MAAQTWDIQLVAQLVRTGAANTASDSFGSASVVQQVRLNPPYSLVFGVGAEPSTVVIAAASQGTVMDVPGATTLDFTGPVAGTTIQIETGTTTS